MIESPLIQEIVAEAEAKGRAEGKAEGKAEGNAEGRTEGTIDTAQKAVLHVLTARFGQVPIHIRAAIGSCADLTRLDVLLDLAVRCSDLEEFRTRPLS